jgi:spore germination protein KC
MSKVRHLVKLTLLITIVLTLTSCGYKDIDKRFFVVSIGVGKAEAEEKKYKVILKLAIPSADIKAGQEQFVLLERESNSITDAVRKIKSRVDKELDFSHAKVILLEEGVFEIEPDEVIDWFIRRRDIQKIAWIGIAKPGIKEILELSPKFERMPSNALFLSFGNTGTVSDYILTEFLYDFWKRLKERGLDPILPIVEANKNEVFAINKAAVFSKNELVLELTEEDTKLVNILLNRSQGTDIGVTEQDGKKSVFFISVDEASSNFTILEDMKKIKVNLELEGLIEEATDDITREDMVSYEKKAEKQLAQEVKELIQKLQKENVDPIGFGLKYRATHFSDNEWETWQAMYQNLEIDVQVEITLQSTGLLKGE